MKVKLLANLLMRVKLPTHQIEQHDRETREDRNESLTAAKDSSVAGAQ
jgi:hypothetical protein